MIFQGSQSMRICNAAVCGFMKLSCSPIKIFQIHHVVDDNGIMKPCKVPRTDGSHFGIESRSQIFGSIFQYGEVCFVFCNAIGISIGTKQHKSKVMGIGDVTDRIER
ncbi:hypothetical protein D3C72_1839590 [compost metagenome]